MSLAAIHPVIIVRDAGATIGTALASLNCFPEVVVFDNGSSDATQQICAGYGNVKLIKGSFSGFGPTKNHAASLASGDWILSVDADEYLSDELVRSLDEADLADAHRAFLVERHNLFMGRHVKRGGWGNDWLVRLYHRGQHRFTDALVHEKIELRPDSTTARLDGALWHQAVSDIDQFLHKISRYTELRRGVPGRVYRPGTIMLRAGWAFIRSYVLKLGLLEGWRGLVIAFCESNGSFFRHMKRYVDARRSAELRRSQEPQ